MSVLRRSSRSASGNAPTWALASTVGITISLLAAVTCAGSTPVGPSDAVGTTLSPCAGGLWSAPQPVLTPSSSHRIARFPNIAVGQTATYVVGTDIASFDGTPVPPSPLTLVTLQGVDLGRPAGQFNFAMPTAIVDSQGRLHLLWAEPLGGFQQVTSDMWPPHMLGSVWTASYSVTGGWSAPEKIFDTGRQILWDPVTTAEGALVGRAFDASKVSRIAVPLNTFTGELTQPVLLLRLVSGAWKVDTVQNSGFGGPISATYGADGTSEYVAYLGIAPKAAAADVNSVLFQRSSDAGRTWSDVRLISRSGTNPAYDLQLVVGPAGSLHLIWFQTTTGDNRLLRHRQSSDGGMTWTPVVDDGQSLPRRRLRAAADACGAVHVIYEDWSRGPESLQLAYAMWDRQWLPVQHPFADWFGQTPSLAVTKEGRLLLVFLGHANIADTLARDAPVYSQRTP